MLSLTLSKEALNLTKRDVQKQNRTSSGLWPMTGNNLNQLVTSLTIHRLTGQKDVMQMLHKMDSTASYYLDIIQENKIWANIAVSRKAVTKNLKIQRMV